MSNSLQETLMGDLKVKGFCDLSQTSMSLNESTFLFLLTAITVDWDYYHLGKRHGITGNKGVNISMTTPANGIYYVYIDSEDGLLLSSITKWGEKDTKIPVCEIQWTNENNPKYVITDKRLLVSDSIGGTVTSTDSVTEGSTNLYFTTSRVRATVLTGIGFLTGTDVTAADSILVAIGKLQTQINANLRVERRSHWDGTYSYCSRAPFGSLTSNAVWTITRIKSNNDGTVTVATATNVKDDDYLTATYV